MYSLGIDLGTSSIKVSLLDLNNGKIASSAFHPKKEMEIITRNQGWAEQDPETWWSNFIAAMAELKSKSGYKPDEIKSIGISYQMHGLVLVDKSQQVLRPSIIWCDSRAVSIGEKAFENLGGKKILSECLNSPGNFTASKLKWVKDNEPELYSKIYKIMLPGDFLAMKLTGLLNSTSSGMSEGIFWDYNNNKISDSILKEYGIDKSLIPDLVPTFSVQGCITREAADLIHLKEGVPVSYRAGDQPNNAFSLNVLQPGEVAATAGTSGVIYGVTDKKQYDPMSRVNTFLHVNHSSQTTRLGVLLCVNGTGILNSWIKHNIFKNTQVSYDEMNTIAAKAPVGSAGLRFYPFGNGAERVLGNKDIGAQLYGLRLTEHNQSHLVRAAQEGIVFSLNYGLEIMRNTGVSASSIKAGHANMFLSPVFAETFAGIAEAQVKLYNTDGSAGAARAAGYGAGIYSDMQEAFRGLDEIKTINPDPTKTERYKQAYGEWKAGLEKLIK
ncbi:MAG: xylulokinase [Cytophagaceae bacterium]